MAHIHRSRLLTSGPPVRLSRLGKGQFCTAYRVETGEHAGKVLLDVREGCYDKELLRELHRDKPENPHLPAVTALDDAENLYLEPLYGKLTTDSPAWADWRLVRRAQVLARKRFDQWRTDHPRRGQSYFDGAEYNALFVDAAEEVGIEGDLMAALREVSGWAANYGAQTWMEFRPGNLGVDEQGRLVLLDPTFDMEKLWQQRSGKARNHVA